MPVIVKYAQLCHTYFFPFYYPQLFTFPHRCLGSTYIPESVFTATSSSQTYSITLTALQIGTQYFYRVIATNQFVSNSTREMLFLTNDARKLPKYIILYCDEQGSKQFTQIYFRIITCKGYHFLLMSSLWWF